MKLRPRTVTISWEEWEWLRQLIGTDPDKELVSYEKEVEAVSRWVN
jgi:hypothetical protein